ncbi:hypothetical protein PoB_004021300 [Plakobranchus ocellatus]|uniref:Uncharacterized protein n=1 Tax=Plakobranchus ocellatus TaxID=259542 RepID=A0AAV4B4K4_9GAST|nr:hypothetical protein PoB_004021300 [Plakobranchus ocellatus]
MAAEVSPLPAKGEKSPERFFGSQSRESSRNQTSAKCRAEKLKRQEASREKLNHVAPLAMKAEDTISSIWGDSSTPSSPRASTSPMECHPSPSKSLSCPQQRNPKVLHLPPRLPTPSPLKSM